MGEDEQADYDVQRQETEQHVEDMRNEYLNSELKDEDVYPSVYPDVGCELKQKPKFPRRFNKPQEFKISDDHDMEALKLLLQETVGRTGEMEKVVVGMQTWTKTIEAKMAMPTHAKNAISSQLDVQKTAIVEGQSQQKTMMAMLSATNDKLPTIEPATKQALRGPN